MCCGTHVANLSDIQVSDVLSFLEFFPACLWFSNFIVKNISLGEAENSKYGRRRYTKIMIIFSKTKKKRNTRFYFQVIKLLHTESMRGGTRLFFLAGDRVMQKLNSLYIVERSLTKSLRLSKIQVHFLLLSCASNLTCQRYQSSMSVLSTLLW